MSVARGFPNGGNAYSNLVKPIRIDLQFTVASTNSNGLGVTSVKSNGYVRNVFMHTSATPGTGDGLTNPNPAVGYALIQLKQNFNAYITALAGFVCPLSGSDLAITSGLTVGNPYVISVLGTSTAADWTAIGLPAGFTAAVGQSFIATSTGHGSGTGKVQVPSVSGVSKIEVVGTPSTLINNSSIAANGGAWLMIQFLGQSSAFTYNSGTPSNSTVATTLAAAAPANNSVVSLSMFFDGSSVTVDGL